VIDINDLKSHSALSLLEDYDGINPYIKKLKNEFIKNKKIQLTENQSRYIVDNHDKEPQYINRVIGITPYLGEELKKLDDLSFIPEKVLIEFILADTDKSFHIYGKLKQNQKESKMYWLPKTQVTDDPYFEPIDVNVDLSKYNEILSKYGKTLYKHQEDGIKFLLSRNGCILADDMGLGKSMQSIIAALESGAEKILIVTTSSTKINWQREINVFCDETTIVDGKKWDSNKFTIINFDILKNFHTLPPTKKLKEGEKEPILIKDMVNEKFDLCIVDEAHNLKNNESIRGKIMVDLCVKHNIPKVWLLTGTPVANRPMDFFNLLKIIKSPIADNWKHYAVRYCEGKKFFRTLKNGQRKQIWITDGASNLEELANKTKNILLRRLKTDAIDMPDKIVTPMYHQLDKNGWRMYDKLVFTSFSDELEIIANHFGKAAVKHNGPMSSAKKQHSVDQFQNNEKVKVFVGNIKSAGVGITLTEATVVIFNSFDWVTGNNEQAEDRAYRIGQNNDVNVYYQLFEDTISVRMWETLKQKKQVINTILGVDNASKEDETDLLIQKILDGEL